MTARAISTGVLRFGDVGVDCYNLEDGRRVFSQRGVLRALRNPGKSGGAETGNLDRFLERIPEESRSILAGPNSQVEFILPSGTKAIGRDADWFVSLCRAYVDAGLSGGLRANQMHLARQASMVVAACAKVGIAALIDEATGYQYVRQHGILGEMFAKALRPEPANWKRTWRDDVIDPLCLTFRIQRVGSEFPAPLMGVIGKLYRTLIGADVHDELKRRNPRGEDREVHTQWMSDDTLLALAEHMNVIRALAVTADSKHQFWERLERYASGGRGQTTLPMRGV